jgi:hypothetical protein
MPMRSFAPSTRCAESAEVETTAVVCATRLMKSRLFMVSAGMIRRMNDRRSTSNSSTREHWERSSLGQQQQHPTNSSYSTIGGRERNNIAANPPMRRFRGDESNFTSRYAFAAGRRAKVRQWKSLFAPADLVQHRLVTKSSPAVPARATSVRLP